MDKYYPVVGYHRYYHDCLVHDMLHHNELTERIFPADVECLLPSNGEFLASFEPCVRNSPATTNYMDSVG